MSVFLPSVTLHPQAGIADRGREFPELAAWLGKVAARPLEARPEDRLCAAFGATDAGAFATYTAAIDLEGESAGTRLMRCDPVHLHADPNRILLYAAPSFDLAPDEADELLGRLRAEFPVLGWRRGEDPVRWYAEPPPELEVAAPSAHWASGRSLTPLVPGGPAQRAWRRWLNDVQMVLHDAPVNATRAAQGAPPINGLWFFGGAVPGARQPTCCAQALGNDALLLGLARRAGVPAAPAAAHPAVWLKGHGTGWSVVIAGRAFGRAHADSAEITLRQFDAQWLPVLGNALRFGRLRQLEIVTASHVTVLDWRSAWRWRRASASFTVD